VGSGTATITVTAKDASGNPVSGATVVLSASGTGNTLTQPVGPTNGSGVATGTLSSSVAETKTISATANGTAITQTATVEVQAVAPGSITHALLTGGTDTTNQKVYTTGSIAPAPKTLITIAVLGHRGVAATPSPIVTGGGMAAWEEVATVVFDSLSIPSKRMTIYRAMSASPGSGPLTITFANTVSNAQWIVSQWSGVDLSGVNGAGAIVQTGSASADRVTTLTVTLNPFAHANNVAYGVVGVKKNVPAVNPGAGFTEIDEQPSGETTTCDLQAEWATNDNTINATWTRANSAVLGVEIRAADTGT
jgi:adhesin/invasin